MKNTFKKIMASATAVTSLAVGMVGLSASAKELNEGVSFSVTTNTINETVVADDGTIIPIGSTAVTVSVTGNAGFDSSTTKLDIGTANVIVNNEGNPIYSVGDVLESSMVASAANDNFVAFSTASADEVCRDGDMFTFYISSGFAGVEIVDNERETFQPVNNAISPRGTLRSYMIGDVDQDNRIDASDASTILHAVSVYEDAFNDDVLPVNYANAHLSTYFPKASRADIAAMLQNVRVAAGIDKNPVTANNDCPMCPVDKKAFIENEELVKIPTLQLKFKDQVSAKSSHVGQRFAAKTLEDVTINGQLFPCGSNVHGKVVEVVRPSGCQKGALKLAFTDIENNGCKATLPRQILNAEINKSNTPNIVSRIVTAPLTWGGQMLGIVGRTTGGMLSNLGNALEDVASGTGIALGEAFQGQFAAAGRSVGDVVVDTVKAPIDFTRTAVSGVTGLVQATGDEIGYLVDAKGYKISAINPKEHVTIAFGCSGQ